MSDSFAQVLYADMSLVDGVSFKKFLLLFCCLRGHVRRA